LRELLVLVALKSERRVLHPARIIPQAGLYRVWLYRPVDLQPLPGFLVFLAKHFRRVVDFMVKIMQMVEKHGLYF
jgi:hypothetical protein